MRKLIELLEQVNRMDRHKAEDLFGYIALYILMIGAFACIIAAIVSAA